MQVIDFDGLASIKQIKKMFEKIEILIDKSSLEPTVDNRINAFMFQVDDDSKIEPIPIDLSGNSSDKE